MTELIAHRINTIEELLKLPKEYGAEVDLRDGLDGRIYMQHDPFKNGEDFENFLSKYKHGTLILNIKSERIEFKILQLLERFEINDYFFLDSSFPMIKNLVDRGEHKIALRFSEYEGLENLGIMKGKVEWVWVDCFNKFPLNREIEEKIHSLGYKICIVSPELQSQPEKICSYMDLMEKQKIRIEAVCTKEYNIKLWEDALILRSK